MIPNFVLFGKVISVYMITALIGILLILYFTYRAAQKKGLDEIHMLYMMLFSMIGVAIGGHLLYGITHLEHLVWLFTHMDAISSLQDFWNHIVFIFGGSVFYGGLIGAILVALFYIRKNRLDRGAYSDIAAVSIPLFHTWGRLGCFLSGCCYGIEWEHGFTYTHSAVASANFVPRFPVQLVEAGLNLGLFLLLFRLLRKDRLKGHLLHLYLLIYPAYRFLLEFLRGDDYRGFLFGLSTSQILSLVLFAVSVCSWTMDAKKGTRSPQNTPT